MAAVAGRVDAAVTYEPYLQAAVDEGDTCKMIYTAAEKTGLIADALSSRAISPRATPTRSSASCRLGRRGRLRCREPRGGSGDHRREVGEEVEALDRASRASSCSAWRRRSDFLENDYEALRKDIRTIMSDQGEIEAEPEATTSRHLVR